MVSRYFTSLCNFLYLSFTHSLRHNSSGMINMTPGSIAMISLGHVGLAPACINGNWCAHPPFEICRPSSFKLPLRTKKAEFHFEPILAMTSPVVIHQIFIIQMSSWPVYFEMFLNNGIVALIWIRHCANYLSFSSAKGFELTVILKLFLMSNHHHVSFKSYKYGLSGLLPKLIILFDILRSTWNDDHF